jgi:hypothetical protein
LAQRRPSPFAVRTTGVLQTGQTSKSSNSWLMGKHSSDERRFGAGEIVTRRAGFEFILSGGAYTPQAFTWAIIYLTNQAEPDTIWVMSLDGDSRMALIRVKIERAKKHLRDLQSELIKFKGEHVNVIGPHTDEQTGQIIHSLGPLPVLPFNAMSCAGDVVHNLRSTLDHLAYHLAQVGTPDTEPSIDVSFPISASSKIYESRKARKVKGMRPEAIEAIDRLKPYKGGNDLLWRLHELDNIDKHRFIFTVAPDYLFSGEWFGIALYWHKASDPLFDGVLSKKMNDNAEFAAQKSSGQSQISRGDPLLPFLQQLVNLVEGIVSSFAPLLE